MPEFAAPLWLLGLAAVVLVWWLHRRSRSASLVPVSALFLWRGEQPNETDGRPTRRAHPIWMLRAAVVAALLFALSELVISSPGATPVVIWFDDSASMATLEDGMPRSRLAIDIVRHALHGRTAQLRSLSDHARTLTLNSGNQNPIDAVRRWPHEGGAPSLPPGPGHDAAWWLVTDGANDAVNALASEERFDRVFVVGRETENVGIALLALRRALHQRDRLLGEARVFNAGLHPAHRELRIIASGKDRQADIVDRQVDLAPGAFADIAFATGANGRQITARLSPADALPMDDTMIAATDAFKPEKVMVRGTCGGVLTSALAAHPGVSIVSNERDRSLTIACAQTLAAMRKIVPGPPAIRWYGSPVSAMQSSRTEAQWLAWHNRNPASWFLYPAPGGAPSPEPGASVVLRRVDDDAPIVTSRDAYTDVYLDLPSDIQSGVGATLNLVEGILDAAAGRKLLDPVVTRKRDTTQIRIARGAPLNNVLAGEPRTKPTDFVTTPLFLGLALALMVMELIILAVARMGASRGAA